MSLGDAKRDIVHRLDVANSLSKYESLGDWKVFLESADFYQSLGVGSRRIQLFNSLPVWVLVLETANRMFRIDMLQLRILRFADLLCVDTTWMEPASRR